MSVTYFIHRNDEEKHDFDIAKFNEDIKKKFHGVTVEVSGNSNISYDICWEYYSDLYQFECRMDRDRCTFAIEYFNSSNRMYDYAEYIGWLRSYFPAETEVILCDENYEYSLILSEDISITDIMEVLQ